MQYRYHVNRSVRKLRNKLAITFATAALMAGGAGLPILLLGAVNADSSNINFETSQGYSIGSINGQNGWSALGSVGEGCATYDEGVSSSRGVNGFGSQSFRISNAVTSGCFGDQAFAPALSQPAGEPGALDKNGNPVVSPLSHFDAQFDIASATGAEQPGLAISVSPDNGVGARMSYLRFVDQSDGIHVYFDDVTDPGHIENGDTFNESDIATLSYTAPHNIKFSMDFVPGPDNDIVRIYIDGNLAKTGTSWEDYYRYDTESNPDLVDVSRVVDTLLFRSAGTSDPGSVGNGYLFDNVTMDSLNPVLPSTPNITSPESGSVLTTSNLTSIGWSSSSGTFMPITYQYRAFSDPGYTHLVYSSGWLTTNSIPTPGTPEGSYYIQVRAQDADGNVTGWSNDSSNPYVIYVDDTAPVVSITNPIGGTVSGTVDVKGTVTDLHPYQYYSVVLDSHGNYVAGPGLVYDSNQFTDQSLFAWNTTLVPNGLYTIELEATDAAGNGGTNSLATTQVNVLNLPTNKTQCMNGGWADFGTMFKNQGQCVSWVEHNILGNGTPSTNKT